MIRNRYNKKVVKGYLTNPLVLVNENKGERKKSIVNMEPKIFDRSGATFTVFGYKERVTEENKDRLSKEERDAGLNYRTKLIKTKDVLPLRFRVTQKAKRKKAAAERLIKRPVGYVSTEKFNKRQRNAILAQERASHIKETKKRPLIPPAIVETNENPIHFTFNNLVGQNVHIGHRANTLDPRSLYFMGGVRSGLYVINLLYTVRGLKAGLHTLTGTVGNRGKILFSNIDKRVYLNISEATKNFCLRYSIAARKLPGVLSNFLLTRFHFPGLAHTSQVPSFALSLNRYDHHVIIEADSLRLPSIGIFDSNSNPFLHASYSVPGNDESIITQTFYLRLVFRALRFGHQLFILKWLKRRGRFADYFFKVFHHRIYKSSKHYHKLEKLKNAYYFTNYLNSVDEVSIGNNKYLLSLRNDRDEPFFAEELGQKRLVVPMNNSELAISNFIMNYFIRRKLFQFLYKQLEINSVSPLFHFNLMNMTSAVSEILYPTSHLKNSALYPYSNLLNAFPASFGDYDHIASKNEWFGKPYFNEILQTQYFGFNIDEPKKLKFIRDYCFSNYFLYNARMDRFGWRKKSKTTKKIVYRFLNFLEFKKQFNISKIAEYRSLVTSRHILKPAEFMYRKHRINFLNIELDLKEENLSSI
jgi:ribosomal protein S2